MLRAFYWKVTSELVTEPPKSLLQDFFSGECYLDSRYLPCISKDMQIVHQADYFEELCIVDPLSGKLLSIYMLQIVNVLVRAK